MSGFFPATTPATELVVTFDMVTVVGFVWMLLVVAEVGCRVVRS